MSEILEAGGSSAYAILAIGGLGLVLTLLMAGATYAKRRVPLAIWVLIPLLVAATGALTAWANAGAVFAEVSASDPSNVITTALAGLRRAMMTDWLSRWVAAGLFGCGAWAAAVGSALAPGPDRLFTAGAAAMAFLFTLAGSIGCGAYVYVNELGTEAYMLVGILAFAGTGVSVAATSRSIEDEHMFRVAGMRFASSVCMVMAVSFAGRALAVGNQMKVFAETGIAVQPMEFAEAIQIWGDLAAPVSSVSWMAFGAALAIAWFGFIAELGEVVDRYTLIDVVTMLVLMTGLGAVRLLEHSNTDGLLAIGTNGPATALYGQFGAELPPGIVSFDKEPIEVSPANGGFSDVFVFETVVLEEAVVDPESRLVVKEAVTEDRWNRRYRRSATGWAEEMTDFREVTEVPEWPLIVIEGFREASLVAEVLEKTPEKKAFLLLRAAEVKGDVEVPADLAHKQVTFLPVELLDEEPDLQADLFADAGARAVNHGPIQWFGETDEEREALKYFGGEEGVLASTEATSLHQLFDERARIKSVVSVCLPWITEIQGDATVVTDRRCTMSEGTAAEWRAQAREVWEKPESENIRVVSRKVTGGELDQKEVNEQLDWQLGAFQYCLDTILEEPELDQKALKDRLVLDVYVRQNGSVSSFALGERNKQQLGGLAKCIAKRVKQLEFTEIPPPEPPEDPEEEIPEPEVRSFQLAIDFRL